MPPCTLLLVCRSVMLPHNRTHLSNIRMGTMFYICPAVACKVRTYVRTVDKGTLLLPCCHAAMLPAAMLRCPLAAGCHGILPSSHQPLQASLFLMPCLTRPLHRAGWVPPRTVSGRTAVREPRHEAHQAVSSSTEHNISTWLMFTSRRALSGARAPHVDSP